MVVAQGGNDSVLHDGFKKSPVITPFLAAQTGYITHMDTEIVGMASLATGAGRVNMDDKIDYLAGIMLCKKTGDYVQAGEVIAYLHTSDEKKLPDAEKLLFSAYTYGDEPPKISKTILAVISEDEVKLI